MKKRTNKKLTVQQAKIITFIISAFFFVLFGLLIGIGITQNNVEGIFIFATIFLGVATTTFLIPVFVWERLLPITEPVIDIEGKKVVLDFLNKENFTELSFIPQDDNGGSEYEMLLTIIKRVECKFFAKLKEDDEIILIVKDKEDNDIYSCEISNYSYFNARFKQKSN